MSPSTQSYSGCLETLCYSNILLLFVAYLYIDVTYKTTGKVGESYSGVEYPFLHSRRL